MEPPIPPEGGTHKPGWLEQQLSNESGAFALVFMGMLCCPLVSAGVSIFGFATFRDPVARKNCKIGLVASALITFAALTYPFVKHSLLHMK